MISCHQVLLGRDILVCRGFIYEGLVPVELAIFCKRRVAIVLQLAPALFPALWQGRRTPLKYLEDLMDDPRQPQPYLYKHFREPLRKRRYAQLICCPRADEPQWRQLSLTTKQWLFTTRQPEWHASAHM